MGEYDDMFVDQEAHTPRGVARLQSENERLRLVIQSLKAALQSIVDYPDLAANAPAIARRELEKYT